MELISLVLMNTVWGKAALFCFIKSQEWGEQGREGGADKFRGIWRLASGRGKGQQERWLEDLQVALGHSLLDVQHHLQSWKGVKGDVEQCFTPYLLGASSIASLSLAKILFVSFNGPGVEILPSGDTLQSPESLFMPGSQIPHVSYGQELYPNQLQTHFPGETLYR